MREDNIPVITDREELYDKCENMEQLFDKYYLPLLDKHYSKTYKLQQENQELKDKINKAIEYIEYNNETLYTYEPDYDYEENIVDNYDVSSFREDLLEILKGDK